MHVPHCLVLRRLHTQGWDNYKKEFRQLRRSFRVDEYNTISDLNPPTGFYGKVKRCCQCKGVYRQQGQ